MQINPNYLDVVSRGFLLNLTDHSGSYHFKDKVPVQPEDPILANILNELKIKTKIHKNRLENFKERKQGLRFDHESYRDCSKLLIQVTSFD